jgi:hypothetical protein
MFQKERRNHAADCVSSDESLQLGQLVIVQFPEFQAPQGLPIALSFRKGPRSNQVTRQIVQKKTAIRNQDLYFGGFWDERRSICGTHSQPAQTDIVDRYELDRFGLKHCKGILSHSEAPMVSMFTRHGRPLYVCATTCLLRDVRITWIVEKIIPQRLVSSNTHKFKILELK